jgi:predicted nucleic acid-binding protein
VIVFDASLALKWYFDEPGSAAAEAELARHGGSIIVPAVFLIEVGGALVRRANMQKLLRPEVEAALGLFLSLIAEHVITVRETDTAQLAAAARLALDLGHPLKDCIYLALAMEMRCDLVTGDVRFAAKAQPVWSGVRVLEG